MRWSLGLIVLAGCSSTYRTKTHEFVATTPCGQGPYDIHIKADGKTGEEGVEVIACTPRHLRGVAEMRIKGALLYTTEFGDDAPADNQRCLASPATIATIGGSGGGGGGSAAGVAGAAQRAQPTLIQRPYRGDEGRFADKLCEAYGLQSQVVIGAILTRTDPGDDLHVRLWSNVPNDLEHAIFLVQQLTSKKSKAEVDAEWDKLAKDYEKNPPKQTPREPKKQVAEHGPPPAPLAEAKPAQPTARATWIAGYWQWAGAQWGWVAGFWRDERVAMPAPRVEVPPPVPGAAAVWIGGTWTLRAGAWIWIEGRWQ
ncbi:MAG TPA: YXWGXW repeat-containing protein [Kofleriaceae bacterium]